MKRVGATISSTRVFGVGKSTLNCSISVWNPHDRKRPAMNSAFSLS